MLTSWGQLQGAVLVATSGDFNDPSKSKWWSNESGAWVAAPVPGASDTVDLRDSGTSAIAIGGNPSVRGLEATAGQTTLSITNTLSISHGVSVTSDPKQPNATTALVIAPPVGQTTPASVFSKNVTIGDSGNNVSLELQDVNWTVSSRAVDAALKVWGANATVQVTANSVFKANAGEIDVGPEANGSLEIDQSTVTTTGLVQVGDNTAEAGASQTASVTVENTSQLNAATLEMYNDADMDVCNSSQLAINGFADVQNGNVEVAGGSTAGFGSIVCNGSLEIDGESTCNVARGLSVASGNVTVDTKSSLTSGTLFVGGAGTGTVVLDSGSTLTTTGTNGLNSAQIGDGTNGYGSEVDVNSSSQWACGSGIYIGNLSCGDVLRVNGGTVTSHGPSYVDYSSMAIVSNGTWSQPLYNDSTILDKGTVEVDEGGLVDAGNAFSASNDSIVRGVGQIEATSITVSAGASVEPADTEAGAGIGTLTFSGPTNFAGNLVIDVGAGAPNTPPVSDSLQVTGSFTLNSGASLTVREANGYVPSDTDKFVIVNASQGITKSAAFANIEGTPAGKDANGINLVWHVDYSVPNEVILEAVKATGVNVSSTENTSGTFSTATLAGAG